MAYSIKKYLGDGSNTIFGVPFPFISRDDIEVRVDGELVSPTWLSDAQLRIEPAPADQLVVDIRRVTQRAERIVDFQDGSVLTEATLDQDSNQLFYVAQEAFDTVEDAVSVDTDNKIDAEGKVMKNLGTPEAPTDAVTKEYVDSTTPASAAAAEASADAADASAKMAEQYAAEALIHKNGAEAAQGAAEDARDAAQAYILDLPSTIVESVTAGTGLSVGGTAAEPQVSLDLTSENLWDAQQRPKRGVLTDAATVDWNAATAGQVVTLTLGGSRTLAAPASVIVDGLYVLRVKQDSTGGRTLAWDTAYKFPTGVAPTLSPQPGATDIFSFVGGAGGTLEYIGQDVR